MLRINKDTTKSVISALKAQSYPAYTNWVDYVSLPSLSEKECIVLYSGEMKINNSFLKEEFYILKNILTKKNPVIYGIVFHLNANKIDNYDEVAFVKSPVLEPSGIGEVIFQNQTIRLDQDNQIGILSFLELDLPNKIKDIFLFNINEFSQNGA